MESFSDFSPMLEMARKNKDLLERIWESFSDTHILAKPFLLPFAVFHTILCSLFIVLFSVGCLLDVISWIVKGTALGIQDKAEELADAADMGFLGLRFIQ